MTDLADQLRSQGYSGEIAAPVWTNLWKAEGDFLRPAALLAYAIDPPITDGPFGQWGPPEYRCRVTDRVTADLVARMTSWAAFPGNTAGVGAGAGNVSAP